MAAQVSHEGDARAGEQRTWTIYDCADCSYVSLSYHHATEAHDRPPHHRIETVEVVPKSELDTANHNLAATFKTARELAESMCAAEEARDRALRERNEAREALAVVRGHLHSVDSELQWRDEKTGTGSYGALSDGHLRTVHERLKKALRAAGSEEENRNGLG